MQRTSRRLGMTVGEHRARRIVKLLVHRGAIEPAGSYRQAYNTRQPSGFRVPLFRIRAMRASRRPSRITVSVRRQSWWKHPLFGFGVEKYPRSLPKRLQTWKEPP